MLSLGVIWAWRYLQIRTLQRLLLLLWRRILEVNVLRLTKIG